MLSTTALPSLMIASWLTGPQSTFDTAGPVARSQLEVFYVTLWVTGIIFVIVASLLAFTTIKFRARSTGDEHAPPPRQSHGNPLVELSLIAASVCALIIIAIPTLRALTFTCEVPEAERAGAYEVNATGFQWWFKFEYPGEQIDLPGNGGKAPLTVANELVIPAGRPVRINLRTYDVIHSFWVPKLAGKVDMIPNRGNHIWLQADAPGYFWGQCAEFCGESHAVMRFRVIALDEHDFAAWLAAQKQNARDTSSATPPANSSATPAAGSAAYACEKLPRNAPGYSAAFDANPLQNMQRDANDDLTQTHIPRVRARDAFWHEKYEHKNAPAASSRTASSAAPSAPAAAPAHEHIHMPGQSWFPLLTALSILSGGLFLANHALTGALASAACVVFFVACWAFEGPGGYSGAPFIRSPARTAATSPSACSGWCSCISAPSRPRTPPAPGAGGPSRISRPLSSS